MFYLIEAIPETRAGLARFRALGEWYGRIKARPSFARTLPELAKAAA